MCIRDSVHHQTSCLIECVVFGALGSPTVSSMESSTKSEMHGTCCSVCRARSYNVEYAACRRGGCRSWQGCAWPERAETAGSRGRRERSGGAEKRQHSTVLLWTCQKRLRGCRRGPKESKVKSSQKSPKVVGGGACVNPGFGAESVSYTHLTLPTICSV